MNQNPRSTGSGNSIYPSKQNFGEVFSFDVNSHAAPYSNETRPFELWNRLMKTHKKKTIKKWFYASVVMSICGVIGLIIFGVSYAVPKCNTTSDQCVSADVFLLAVGISIAAVSFLILLGFICSLASRIINYQNDADGLTEQDQLFVWRFDGDEWICFLNHLCDHRQDWRRVNPSCCCQRNESLERLKNRQYGHVIFSKIGFIIDESYLVLIKAHGLVGAELTHSGNNSSGLGLIIHTCTYSDGDEERTDLNIYPPSSVSREQLQTILQWYNRTVNYTVPVNM